MKISAKTKFCLIVGDPVDHSLSPAIHNAAYQYLGIDDQFVYLGSNVKISDLEKVVLAMRVMKNFRGLTCTIPHKIEVLKYLDWIDPVAKKIGAVNTVLNADGVLKGYNTDWQGAIIPLEKITFLKNKKVAVIGAGGAARAIVYGLLLKKAKVKIFNRTVKKAIDLAKEFGCEGAGLNEQKEIKDFEIVINATSVGMKPVVDKISINEQYLNKNQIVFDIVYTPIKTKLLKLAEEKGAKIISGAEMLLYQAIPQFEIYTGFKAPVEIMRKTLYEKL